MRLMAAVAPWRNSSCHQPHPDMDAWTLEQLAALKCNTHKLLRVRALTRKCVRARTRQTLRSGGFIVSVTPESYITDVVEFLGAESCMQRYMFLARLKQLYPELKIRLHDDACHLRRFAHKCAHLSVLAKSISYPALKFSLARFHASGHIDPWCLDNVHPGTQETHLFYTASTLPETRSCSNGWQGTSMSSGR